MRQLAAVVPGSNWSGAQSILEAAPGVTLTRSKPLGGQMTSIEIMTAATTPIITRHATHMSAEKGSRKENMVGVNLATRRGGENVP